MGEILPGDSFFTFFEPFIFVSPVLDLEPRTEADSTDSIIVPNRTDLAIDCSDFALSDLKGFFEAGEVNFPFNGTDPANEDPTGRFDFDFSSIDNYETDNVTGCDSRCGAPVIGAMEDADANGLHDECQHIPVAFHDASKGRDLTIRRRVRNTGYDGSVATGSGFPVTNLDTFDSFDEAGFSGQVLPIDSNQIAFDNRYDEILTLDTPGGIAIPGTGQEVVLNKPGIGGSVVVSALTYDASDYLFGGTSDLGAGTVQGFGLFTRDRVDMVTEERKLGPAWPTPLRAVGPSVSGDTLYVAAGDRLFVYETDCLTKKSTSVLNSDNLTCANYELGQVLGANGLGLNVEPRAVSVEPDDDYVYAASGDPDTIPGDGWLSVLHRSDHSLFADPGTGQTLLSEIRGTPVDIAVVNLDDGGNREAVVYVVSQTDQNGNCPGGGGGGGGGNQIEPNGFQQTSFERRVFLSAHKMSRPNFGDADLFPGQSGEMELFSCTTETGALSLDTTADGRIFVVSEVDQEMVVIETNADGSLDHNSEVVHPLPWAPTDVFIGEGPSLFEVAVVAGVDSGAGIVRYYPGTSSLGASTDIAPPGANRFDVVMIRDFGRRAYAADAVAAEIRSIDLDNQVPVDTETIQFTGTLEFMVVQRRQP